MRVNSSLNFKKTVPITLLLIVLRIIKKHACTYACVIDYMASLA